jgi:hypothetical protein
MPAFIFSQTALLLFSFRWTVYSERSEAHSCAFCNSIPLICSIKAKCIVPRWRGPEVRAKRLDQQESGWKR